MKHLIAGLTAAALLGAPVMADTQGVTADSIKLGTYTDLSGPLAVWGVPSVNGMRMRIEEANAAGGVHGRTIELVVEDMQYQVPRAVQAAGHDLNYAALSGAIWSVGDADAPPPVPLNVIGDLAGGAILPVGR